MRESILLVKLRGIGDSVLSLPSVEALRRLYPQARLRVLVPPASIGVFSQDRRVDEVLVYDKKALGSVAAQAALWQELQSRHIDLAFCPHASFRTALLAWLSGAEERSVRNHSGRDWFNTVACEIPKEPKSILEREFDGLRSLGYKGPLPEPKMALGPAGKAWAAAWWKKNKPKSGSLILAPGASVKERRWPLEHFIALAQALKRRGKGLIWMTAPGEELPLPRPLMAQVRLASPPDVQALGALASKAGALLGNNSGPRHLAAASGARTMALFGVDLPREWHPYEESRGHWALRAESGKIADLSVAVVLERSLAWMKS
jgi:ADP-heptose:LPS heptosyltransferase